MKTDDDTVLSTDRLNLLVHKLKKQEENGEVGVISFPFLLHICATLIFVSIDTSVVSMFMYTMSLVFSFTIQQMDGQSIILIVFFSVGVK